MTVPKTGFESILSTTWYFNGGFGAPKMHNGGMPPIFKDNVLMEANDDHQFNYS